MTFREKYRSCNLWVNKVKVMHLYHSMLVAKQKSKWRIKDTAAYFHVSVGLACENLELAKNLELVGKIHSREKALFILSKRKKELNNG